MQAILKSSETFHFNKVPRHDDKYILLLPEKRVYFYLSKWDFTRRHYDIMSLMLAISWEVLLSLRGGRVKDFRVLCRLLCAPLIFATFEG